MWVEGWLVILFCHAKQFCLSQKPQFIVASQAVDKTQVFVCFIN